LLFGIPSGPGRLPASSAVPAERVEILGP